MTIVFLCSCLEPGKDGVGDYTRKLASELIKHGHQVAAISLNDKNIDEDIKGLQTSDGTEISVLRLAAKQSLGTNVLKAKEFIDAFNPGWISLQYVPYGFNDKGLPFGLAKELGKLTKGRRFNIMFHEMWIGISVISPLKHKITGFMQRRIANSLVKVLKPHFIATTNLLYKLILKRMIGAEAEILPLFSNIPIAPLNKTFRDAIFNQLRIEEEESEKWHLVGIFGNLYPEAELESTLTDQLSIVEKENKHLAIIGFGNINEQGLSEFHKLEKLFEGKVKFLHLGIQPEDKISNLLQILNLGISCTPSQHIGKSGVFATMKLHSLQVILPKGDILPEYDSQIKDYNLSFVQRPANEWGVSHIAVQFEQLLAAHSASNKGVITVK